MLSSNFNQEKSMKKYIIFTCPICKEKGSYKIKIPMIKANGFFAVVLISKRDICPYEFLAYIDNHHNIRDYQKIDFTLADLEQGIEVT